MLIARILHCVHQSSAKSPQACAPHTRSSFLLRIEGSLQPLAGQEKTGDLDTVWWEGGRGNSSGVHVIMSLRECRVPGEGPGPPAQEPQHRPALPTQPRTHFHSCRLLCPQQRHHRGLVSCNYELNQVAAVCWEADVVGAAGPTDPTAQCPASPSPAAGTPGP